MVFDDCYRDNPLVNVLCLGVLPVDRLVLAKAEGVGNVAVLLGSATGRDGIGGASVLASAGFSEGDEAKRPSVQVGDPYEEKRLIEACLELLDAGLAVGVQDLGAAGISCAASETAAKTGAGMDVDLARMPKREPGMNGVEVMTSESQERMLAIVTPANLDAGARPVPPLGDPGLGHRPRHRHRAVPCVRRPVRRGRRAGREPAGPARRRAAARCRPTCSRSPTSRSPASATVPVYDRPATAPRRPRRAARRRPRVGARAAVPVGHGPVGANCSRVLASPNIADKSWVYRQYDHQLFLNTVVAPGGDASVLRLKGTSRALALTTDGKARFCALDPYTGARLTVIEAARNLACVGAVPKALVNCLNFGNPEHPEVMWQFAEVVDGMSDACRALVRTGRRRQRQLLQRVARPRHRPHPGDRRGRAHRRAHLRAAAGRAARR